MAKFRTAEPPLVAYTKDGSNWTLLKGKLSVQNPPKRFLEDSSFSLLHDFDEHLESLDKDWLANGSAAKLIDAA